MPTAWQRETCRTVPVGAVAVSGCSVWVVIVQGSSSAVPHTTAAATALQQVVSRECCLNCPCPFRPCVSFNQPPKGVMSVALPWLAAGVVIGVLLNRVDHNISFTKNGMDLGVAFRDVREERLYPTVGMRTPDEEVLANFGSNSFRTNVEMLRAEAAEKVHSAIEHTQLPSKGRVRRAAATCVAASWSAEG